MGEQEIYDPAVADGRFQLEILALRWVLVALYAVLTLVGVISVDRMWFAASEGFLVAYHLYYTWYVWHELTRAPLPPEAAYATPFLDTVAVSLALIAVGDPLHPIWAAYFFIIVGIAFFYYPIVRFYIFWLLANYSVAGIAVHWRGLDVSPPYMIVASIILLCGMFNLIAYTGGERRLRKRISVVARTDPLTNLLNRRGLEEELQGQLELGRDRSKALAVLMLDVDWFKRANDQYGHLAADGILEQLAKVLSAAVREPDLVARYGGDEFVVVVPDVSAEEAIVLAERLCQQIARLGLCTVSIGVSVSEDEGATARALLDLADAALLEAKHSGRNRVRVSGTAPERAA